ncbi:MAG: ornithine carbamoyltransferase [Halobacteriota archaeon]
MTATTPSTPDGEGTTLGVTDVLAIEDLRVHELRALVDRARSLKAGAAATSLEPGTTLGLLFEKPSTRTRVSFEVAMARLGGSTVYLGREETHLGRGEPVPDTGRVLGRYLDGIVARLFDHADLVELAEHAACPVINGLTDRAHPCQALADLVTVEAHIGTPARLTWIGDANNVARSFVAAASMLGHDVIAATPRAHAFEADFVDRLQGFEGTLEVSDDPEVAVAGADVVYTDVWVSMGEEADRDDKLAAFDGFQVNEALLSGTDARVMHCLPANRGEEVTDAVLTGDRSLVWDQAENRLHAQAALLEVLLGGD